jgi:hypothetical protein
MIKIIDNFLEPSYLKNVQESFNNNFPWYYTDNISLSEDCNLLTSFGFFHIFVRNNKPTDSPYVSFLAPLFIKMLNATNLKTMLRIRSDMTVYSKEKMIHQPHNDFLIENDGVSNEFITSIFYVNNSDGDTLIFNEKRFNDKEKNIDLKNLTIKERITPKENRFVMFSGSYIHTGHSPSNHKNRILINANFDI